MKIYILFGQRKQRYDGEHAPETLEAIDEYGYDESPLEWLEQKKKWHTATNEFDSLAVITIEIPDREIVKRLAPEIDVVPSTVLG